MYVYFLESSQIKAIIADVRCLSCNINLKALSTAAADDILILLFFRENKTWHIEIPSLIFSEK